jgi:hypothetical protein
MRTRILNVIFLIAVIYVNYLANALPINGKNTGELSNQYANLFVPAGITFAIWGLIYLMLITFAVLQFVPAYRAGVNEEPYFVLSCFFNIAWIFAWHYEFIFLSILCMLSLLATLALINFKLISERRTLKLFFGVYLGWICIATIANITALLIAIKWDGFGISEVSWTITLISAGILVACLNMYLLKNPFLAISVIWAFYGIVLKRSTDQPSIVITAQIGMVLVALAAVFVWMKSLTSKVPI